MIDDICSSDLRHDIWELRDEIWYLSPPGACVDPMNVCSILCKSIGWFLPLSWMWCVCLIVCSAHCVLKHTVVPKCLFGEHLAHKPRVFKNRTLGVKAIRSYIRTYTSWWAWPVQAWTQPMPTGRWELNNNYSCCVHMWYNSFEIHCNLHLLLGLNGAGVHTTDAHQ